MRNKNKIKQTKDSGSKNLIIFMIRGNRQIEKFEINASKKFNIKENTYIIKDKCVYTKKIEGKLRPVSIYREGNPNPYDFSKTNNYGLTHNELNYLVSNDVFQIWIKALRELKMKYMLILQIVIFIFALLVFLKSLTI